MNSLIPAIEKPTQPVSDYAPDRCPSRGCVFFSFGKAYVLRTLVAVFSLRQVYNGPITVFLGEGPAGVKLKPQLEELDCRVVFINKISKSSDKHRIFLESPYETTLVFDSDLLFLKPIDELWRHIETAGLLITRFFPAPHGVDGTPESPGWADRMAHLEAVREFIDPETFSTSVDRLINQRIDINVGVMGIARPLGDGFLDEWSDAMERARPRNIVILDEMLTVALSAKHHHYLAAEKWNCPADEFFRRTNLADANIIHYFADGHRVHGIRLGRNPSTWAGKKWYEMYRYAARSLDLKHWAKCDPIFAGRFSRAVKAITR